eukprot:Plantae.Rhodophyta-Rhodochaete_pulchella.ctg74099.p2 GENE.Plantae.Rhodophyta-Rhodochaete_pulchella.ctg74099~~Plantae.Rhodophyta-Rhodochaete_pulchella.ctg74099.p2  ORF type:complete len:100 (+),score=11.07 Plantae.Rhodophyta-Rhodochaete_pulchella.ctg74099:3-302(+)
MAADNGKLIASVFSTLLCVQLTPSIGVDSKSLYDTMSTVHAPPERSVRAIVALLRYDFERRYLRDMFWLPGAANPADSTTKRNSPLLRIVRSAKKVSSL